jgi:hypothetical protein
MITFGYGISIESLDYPESFYEKVYSYSMPGLKSAVRMEASKAHNLPNKTWVRPDKSHRTYGASEIQFR